MNYYEKLKDPRWQKKRLEIMSRDDFACVYCKDKKSTLNVHHESYNGNPWEVENKELITLCHKCHNALHHLDNPDFQIYKDDSFSMVVIQKILYTVYKGKIINVNKNILLLSLYFNLLSKGERPFTID